MIKNIVIASSCLALFACNNESGNSEAKEADTTTTNATPADMNNTLTDEQKKEGWQLLFDGVSTSGWHKYGNTPAGTSWKVADGTLYLDASDTLNGKIRSGGDITRWGEAAGGTTAPQQLTPNYRQ